MSPSYPCALPQTTPSLSNKASCLFTSSSGTHVVPPTLRVVQFMESSSPEELPIRKPGCYETLYWAPLSMTEQPITPRVVVKEGSVLLCSQILWVRSLCRRSRNGSLHMSVASAGETGLAWGVLTHMPAPGSGWMKDGLSQDCLLEGRRVVRRLAQWLMLREQVSQPTGWQLHGGYRTASDVTCCHFRHPLLVEADASPPRCKDRAPQLSREEGQRIGTCAVEPSPVVIRLGEC